jgi:hypothetical protein
MDLENLGKIKRLEAPPYLFTRIKQRIEQSKKERLPRSIAVALSFSFAVLLVINTLVIVKYNSAPNAMQSYAQSINLTSNNSLYQ